MLNLSDKELDNLSREAAENFEPAENVQSWNKLGQLLDKNLGAPAPVPRPWSSGTSLIYYGAILIAIAFTYFLTKSNKNNQTSTRTLTLNNHQQTGKGTILDSNLSAIGNSKLQNQSKERMIVQNEKEVSSHSVKLSNLLNKENKEYLAKNKPGKEGQEKSPEKNSNNVLPSKTGHSAAEDIKRFPGSLRDDNKVIDQRVNGNRSSSLGREPEVGSAGNSSHVPSVQKSDNRYHRGMSIVKSAPHRVDSENKNPENTSANILATKNRTETQDRDVQKWSDMAEIASSQGQFIQVSDSGLRNFNSRTPVATIKGISNASRTAFVDRSLEIGFSFAPEFSKVKYIYTNNRLGNSFGITLGYQLFSKLSLNTGVLLSQKYYQASSQQYHGPPDAAGSSLKIEFVDASASVIDIPLNIRYNYFSDANSTFFVNGGFSSYLMKSQNFTYYCKYEYAGFNYQRWIRPEPAKPPEGDYLFSMINLSTGFQTSISHSFSFQFEPYMKIPVRETGFGKVDLSSYGINISLKYAPILKRGRR